MVVAPNRGFNCYFPMPFQKAPRPLWKTSTKPGAGIFFQIDYCLQEVPENAGTSTPSGGASG